ncbi:hypothetical protein RI367_006573 [Sorochytrium milnesiophthora]
MQMSLPPGEGLMIHAALYRLPREITKVKQIERIVTDVRMLTGWYGACAFLNVNVGSDVVEFGVEFLNRTHLVKTAYFVNSANVTDRERLLYAHISRRAVGREFRLVLAFNHATPPWSKVAMTGSLCSPLDNCARQFVKSVHLGPLPSVGIYLGGRYTVPGATEQQRPFPLKVANFRTRLLMLPQRQPLLNTTMPFLRTESSAILWPANVAQPKVNHSLHDDGRELKLSIGGP